MICEISYDYFQIDLPKHCHYWSIKHAYWKLQSYFSILQILRNFPSRENQCPLSRFLSAKKKICSEIIYYLNKFSIFSHFSFDLPPYYSDLLPRFPFSPILRGKREPQFPRIFICTFLLKLYYYTKTKKKYQKKNYQKKKCTP